MSGPIYFGCWGTVGHFMWTREGGWMHGIGYHDEKKLPKALQPCKLDGVHAPLIGKKEYPNHHLPEAPQGQAAIVHVEGWTVLAFWDRSVDKRGASNSAFLLLGTLTFEDARDRSKEAFPEVWARFQFEVVLA